ncbi:unnamed protein product [Cuscuta campestris]|uniref:Phospho-N-acetylmuramoyl-pentapeptide-transferase n=1 Tax=Cuscuta campestris TaxID=132261 RepID=A0A484NSQ6_9ASTE|nr:unnamed protein product [Cuscuta campestris]
MFPPESFRVGAHKDLKISRVNPQFLGFRLQRGLVPVRLMDGGTDFSSFDDWGESEGTAGYAISSSDGEESDEETMLETITDLDLPTTRERFSRDDSITLAAHRLAMLGRARRREKIFHGVLNNIGLVTFSTFLLFLADLCAWRIVRLPLAPFYMMRPFLTSAVAVSCVGYLCVPLFRTLRLRSLIRREVPAREQSAKRGTPTMGGLYFIPIGVLVADIILGFSSVEVLGASAATLAFATIGFLDDLVHLKTNSQGLSAWIKIPFEVAIGIWFSFWLNATDISSPYSMKSVVPLPAPIGLVCIGKFYPILTSFCFTSMVNGVDLTDDLDGLAGGTAALAFIGMSIVVLPLCPDLAVFGASIAGACVGFLMHNRYRASIIMGDTGALALGGALASMASVTGQFFPLFIVSGIFVVEALSLVLQVSFSRASQKLPGKGRPLLLQTAPFHRHLKMRGLGEPAIVAGAYAISCVLVLCAGYVGLISV